MKKLIITLALLLNTFCVYAQDSPIEEEIRKLEETECKAVLNQDTITLKKIWPANFMVNYSPLNQVFIGGQIDMVKSGIIKYSSFTREIEQILVNGDVVITMGSEVAIPTYDHTRAGQTIKRRFTNIWMKQNGSWMLIARHANEI
jgi:hypothetical protein